jgi:pyridoxal phosphate enzyme (YggS family)
LLRYCYDYRMNNITNRSTHLRQELLRLEKQYCREPYSVHLLAVSKGQPIAKIQEAIAAGQLAFGENYLQEALLKIKELNNPTLEWHFIGNIQRNKTKQIAEHFAWVHTIDDVIIAERLNQQRPAHLPPLNVCIQVNISNEQNKSGVFKEEILSLATSIVTLPKLKLRGLMAIPAPQKDFTKQRGSFHELACLYQQLRQRSFELDTLSMGMSDDFEAAIAEGSTLIRLGTAIFGARM